MEQILNFWDFGWQIDLTQVIAIDRIFFFFFKKKIDMVGISKHQLPFINICISYSANKFWIQDLTLDPIIMEEEV